MTPRIEQGGSIPKDTPVKFVRAGETMAYDDWHKSHLTIAEEHDLGVRTITTENSRGFVRIVDDSGYLFNSSTGKEIEVTEKGTTVKHQHIPDINQREETLKVVTKLTQLEAKSG